jgi:protein SCO1/2
MQKTEQMKHNAILSITAVWVTLFAFFPAAVAQQLAEGLPKEVQDVGVDQHPGDSIPLDIRVVDSLGHEGSLASFFDGRRPVLLTLNYSDCPMLCSLQLNQLVGSLSNLDLQIGKDFQIVTLSIDPKETVEKVQATKDKYLQLLENQPQAAEGWHFLTSAEADIKRLTSAVGFRYRYDAASKQYYHPAMLAFISPNGVISRYSLDVAFPPDQVRLAIVETSEGRVGSVVDQFMLLCFQYDAERNRYVASAWKLMRLGALTTVGLLLATLTPYWFGRRRHTASLTTEVVEQDIEENLKA